MDRAEVQRLVTELEDSVMCDGFNGYFFNTEDDPAEALRALEAIGADQTAAIVRRAYARFPGGEPPRDRFVRQAALLDVVDPNDDAFDREDSAFFAYPEDLQQMIVAYGSAVDTP